MSLEERSRAVGMLGAVVFILVYACKVWGYGDLNCIDKVHTDFLKHSLYVKKSTPHIMLYEDLGRFPLRILIRKSYWDLLQVSS